MTKRDEHLADLRALSRDEWEAYLRDHSNLPGPRGNLELLDALGAAVEDADEPLLHAWAVIEPNDAPVGDPGEFVVAAGIVGIGALLAGRVREGARGATAASTPDARQEWLALLHACASDPRWRVREAVAMALQRLGGADIATLLPVLDGFAADPDPLVRRAAVAAICEPALLRTALATGRAIELLDRVTAGIAALPAGERRGDGVVALRKALGYGWSVVIAADPTRGWPAFERWAEAEDRDVRWIVRENLGKARLVRLDPGRVAVLRVRLGS